MTYRIEPFTDPGFFFQRLEPDGWMTIGCAVLQRGHAGYVKNIERVASAGVEQAAEYEYELCQEAKRRGCWELLGATPESVARYCVETYPGWRLDGTVVDGPTGRTLTRIRKQLRDTEEA